MIAAKHVTLAFSRETKHLTRTFITLERQLERATPGDALKLTLVGDKSFDREMALAFYELIRSKRSGVMVHTHSHSCLVNAQVLVWLAGDTRSLRTGAWIHFHDLADRAAERNHLREMTGFRHDLLEAHAELAGDGANYVQIEHLVKKHLPPHLMNRRIWAGELTEWNLICNAQNAVSL